MLAMVAVVSHAGTNSWTTKGPPGGHALGVRAHSTAPNVFYAMFLRSIHRSTDGGVTWAVLRNFEGQVNGLAVDPSDGDRLYVSVYNEGIYRSENRGDSFSIVAPPGSGIWGVGANATTVYYSGADRQVYRSVDRGNTWTARGTASQTLTKIVVDPQNSDRAYGINGPFVLTSTNGGTTWTQVSVSASGMLWTRDIAHLSTNQLAVVADGGIFVSSDGGATWTWATSGDFIAVAADPTTPGRAVASRWSSGSLIETTNYGASWHSFGASSDGRSEGVAVDSQASSRIVLLGSQFARYTTNSAQAWVDATQPPIAHDVSQFATTLASNSKVYAYTNTSRVGGSALFATSGDSGWQRLIVPGQGPDAGQATIAVRPGAPNRIYFGSFGQGVYRSSDGGLSWLLPGTGLNGRSTQTLAFDPEVPDTLYASSFDLSSPSSSGMYRSTDDGATWAPLSTNLNASVYGMDLQIDPAEPSRMFLAALQFGQPNTGGLYRSTDRGTTWTQAFVGQDVRQIAIDPSNSSRIYAATAALQVSNDGGDTFTASNSFAVTTNQPAQSVAIDPVVPTTLYATSSSSSSYVLRSVNSGQTWEVLRAGTEPGPWRAYKLALDPNTPSLLYVSVSGRGVASFEVAPDLHVDISGHSGTRAKNFESTFNLRAVNNGPYAATRVNVSATLPAGVTNISYSADRGTCSTTGCVVPVLQVGEEINAVVRYTTPAHALFLLATATVSGHESDATPTNNTVQASAITGDPGDLGVTVVPSVTTLLQGGDVTYTVTVTNRGSTPSSEGNVTFSLGSAFTLGTLPSGCSASTGGASCDLGTIAVGASQTFTFSAVATNAGAVDASATVTIGSELADIDPANNSATSSVTATTPPPPPPPPSGGNSGGGSGNGGNTGGGGGGGSMDFVTLLGALLLLAGRRRALRQGARPI
ncbi:VPS10 domain-containing protein [Steroidobacter cummioxidans]|uniref:VPS10 domain-containing protein n=1 Tax=Steroidobacter cummioxidans TaxID=1803913 RepID=UPI001F4E6D6A|nr:CARDB domain-containing protein [Steroidobacter cummioxidans]